MVFAQVRERPAIASRFKEVSEADRKRILVERKRNSSNTKTATKNILRILYNVCILWIYFGERLAKWKDLPNEEAIPRSASWYFERLLHCCKTAKYGAHYKLSDAQPSGPPDGSAECAECPKREECEVSTIVHATHELHQPFKHHLKFLPEINVYKNNNKYIIIQKLISVISQP